MKFRVYLFAGFLVLGLLTSLATADEDIFIRFGPSERLAFGNGEPGRCLSMATFQKAVLSDVIYFEPSGPKMSWQEVRQQLRWVFSDEMPVVITGFRSIKDLSMHYGEFMQAFLNEYNWVENATQVFPDLFWKKLGGIEPLSNEQIATTADEALRAGSPVILSVDVTYGDGQSTNHAVLITGRVESGSVVTYVVYDSNAPDDLLALRYQDGKFHYYQVRYNPTEVFNSVEAKVELFALTTDKFKNAKHYSSRLEQAKTETGDTLIKGVGKLRNRGFFSGGLSRNYVEVEGFDLYPLESTHYDLSKFKNKRVAFRGSLIWTGDDVIKMERNQPVYNVEMLYEVTVKDDDGNFIYTPILSEQ